MNKFNLSIMYSGGLDSYIAYHVAKSGKYTPQLIHVDLGHPYAGKEKKAMDEIGLPYTSINASELYPAISHRITNHIIPSRNVLFAVVGSMFNSRVWICALDGEQYGKENDKSVAFFNDISALLSFTNNFFQKRTIVESPFLRAHQSKVEVVNWAVRNLKAVELRQMLSTNSCYSSEEGHCGKCLTCYKRYVALRLNGFKENVLVALFKSHPLESDYAKEMDRLIPIASSRMDYSRFTLKRCREYFELKKLVGDDIDRVD
jgi:7-cyano-7-deazaguanine synthase in queuosine biosynthesis